MNTMESPKFIINNYLSRKYESFESLQSTLFENGILTKDYPDDGLFLLYHKYDTPAYTELEMECRSLVVNRETLKIVAYSCEVPRLNTDGINFLKTIDINKTNRPVIVNDCYEGTLLSLFYHNNKWYLSSRRCLDSRDSLMYKNIDIDSLKDDDKIEASKLKSLSHFNMFEEILQRNNMTFDEFTSELDTELSYYFVLIHHKNKHIIDYTYLFSSNYGKLLLISARKSDLSELNITTIYDDYFSDVKDIFIVNNLYNNVMLNTNYTSLDHYLYDWDERCRNMKFVSQPKEEGVIIKVWDNELNRYNIVKLQYPNYQYHSLIKNGNINRGFVYLYQHNRLNEYPNSKVCEHSMSALITSTLKVVTNELFQLFKILYSLKTGKQYNSTIYESLPNEYKTALFGLRGIFFKHKSEDTNKELLPWLKISDIFNFLKDMETEKLINLLGARALIMNPTDANYEQIRKAIPPYSNLLVLEQCNNLLLRLFN